LIRLSIRIESLRRVRLRRVRIRWGLQMTTWTYRLVVVITRLRLIHHSTWRRLLHVRLLRWVMLGWLRIVNGSRLS
jgi:hypothetical protein